VGRRGARTQLVTSNGGRTRVIRTGAKKTGQALVGLLNLLELGKVEGLGKKKKGRGLTTAASQSPTIAPPWQDVKALLEGFLWQKGGGKEGVTGGMRTDGKGNLK